MSLFRSHELFGDVEEPNFQAPAPPGEELIGLEYLFSQSEGDVSSSQMYDATARQQLQESSDVVISGITPLHVLLNGLYSLFHDIIIH